MEAQDPTPLLTSSSAPFPIASSPTTNASTFSSSLSSSSSGSSTPAPTSSEVAQWSRTGKSFPLHEAVWKYDLKSLMRLIQSKERDINERDHRGNSPLHLAVHLRRADFVQLLIANGADPTLKNAGGWAPIKEAIASGHRGIVEELYVAVHQRLHELYQERVTGLMEALEKLPDFYLELHWEFSSWLPFVSTLCPCDTYKIWKKGSSLKVDSTLVGFKTMKWKRGSVSYCFLGAQSDMPGDLLIVNHDKKVVKFAVDYLTKLTREQVRKDVSYLMSRPYIQRNTPIVNDVSVAASNSWFQTKKEEKIGPYNTLVYEMDNLHFIMQKRYITKKSGSPSTPENKGPRNQQLSSSLRSSSSGSATSKSFEKSSFDIETYFNSDPEINPYTLKPNGLLYQNEKQSIKRKTYRMSVWMTDEFPRQITEFLPLFQVLSPTGKHFAKLSKFLNMQLPNHKFPVKIEIPVFPTITATVTSQQYKEVEVDPQIFQLPSSYNFDQILSK
eukprot:TRINITY_DN4915_c0_g1_i1.p1 TRINITY_DN4915_c0_g1~~TRINITY_DN4915_c0_g1_i1.p1  ORF type:complete len:499 (-),score=81.17 TRINITY_DN4915_c0_g1_i1:168-1664(-)